MKRDNRHAYSVERGSTSKTPLKQNTQSRNIEDFAKSNSFNNKVKKNFVSKIAFRFLHIKVDL